MTSISTEINQSDYGRFETPAGDWIGTCLAKDGAYERAMLDAWRPLVGPGAVAIDVGACFGTHSVFLAKQGCRVFAVEPVNTDWLRRNIAGNDVGDRVTVLPFAASDRAGRFAAAPVTGNLGSTSLVAGDAIAARRLDAHIGDGVALVKIDVEGMEAAVLRGMTRILAESRPHLFVECATAEALRAVEAIVHPLGYATGKRYNATPTYHFVPARQRAVVTINLGDVLHPQARASMRAAAARWSADFCEITAPIEAVGGKPHWQKTFLARWAQGRGYDRVAYFDSDILIRDDAPSIFEAVPAGRVGVVRHRDCVGDGWNPASMRTALKWWSAHLGVPQVNTADHLNSGMIVFDAAAHAPLFARWSEAGRSVAWQRKFLVDEAALSVLLNADDLIHWLAGEWNYWRREATSGVFPEYVAHFASAAAKPHMPRQHWRTDEAAPQENEPMEPHDRIGAVMLNWSRPDNARRIVAGWRAHPDIGHCVVWNNQPKGKPPCEPTPGVLLITASRDVGLNSRWLAAATLPHECILIQDDDLELPAETIRRLHAAWLAEPDIIHGIFGRQPKADGGYDYRNAPHGEVPIVLTRALMVGRQYIFRMLQHWPEFEEIQRAGVPNGNGEDIIFSYVTRQYSGKLNRVHALPVGELSSRGAISGRPGHNQHRTRVVQNCEQWLAERSPITEEEAGICR